MKHSHEEVDRYGAIRIADDTGPLGSIVYVRSGEHVVIVQHTGVEERARGQGIGRALFDDLVAWARETETKLVVQCPYARKLFHEHPETSDVLR